MTAEEWRFFDGRPAALEVYEAFRNCLTVVAPDVRAGVRRTQITFSCRRAFACVSFAPVRAGGTRRDGMIVVTLVLGQRVESPRLYGISEPYPGRWTHHAQLFSAAEADEELTGWLREAHAFSECRPRRL